MSAMLIAAGILLCAVSGVPSLFVRSRTASRLSLLMMFCGAAAGLAGVVFGLRGTPTVLSAPWAIPGGALRIRVDALSAFFCAPVFLISAAAALYAEGYWPAERERAGYLRFFSGMLAGGLALVMVAQNMILFLVAWEVVALTAFFAVVTLDEDEGVRDAAWLYLVASHISTLSLFALFGVMHALTASWNFTRLPAGTGATTAGHAIFWLALIGFGIKAGLMPFHIWLPGAHAGAPSQISAVMSGVVIKMGIYGIVRLLTLYDALPDWFGGTLLIAGVVSSVFGVAFALAQHDLKRLLAYHSIENIGIIVTGLGIGVAAQSHGLQTIALLGFAGALLHVWNHGLFKSLLFLAAGSAIHSSGTREMDRMGGLGKRMPWTAAAFLTGAVAICGLPPLNGFVSEWLLYVGSFMSTQRMGGGWTWLALILVAPALALTGALALACFVKAFGTVFLGEPRSAASAAAHESGAAMRSAMLPLALLCIAIGVLPVVFAPAVDRAVGVLGVHGSISAALRPVQTAAIVFGSVLVIAIVLLRAAVGKSRREVTWDCGYAAPTARMQYTSSSFARGLVGFFAWALPPVEHAPRELPLFPAQAAFESHVPDTILDRMIMPMARRAGRVLTLARHIQSGRMHAYLLYIAATVVVLLLWSVL